MAIYMYLYAVVDSNSSAETYKVVSLELGKLATTAPTSSSTFSSSVNINGKQYTKYVVARPSSKYLSGISDDGKSIIIKDGTNTSDDNVIPIEIAFKNVNKLGFNVTSRTLRARSAAENGPDAVGTTLSELQFFDPITLDMSIPMSFKRANTVVNLGRL